MPARRAETVGLAADSRHVGQEQQQPRRQLGDRGCFMS